MDAFGAVAGLRARIAYALGVPGEKVVVRWMDQYGQYGRTAFGGDGAEVDAAILSQLAGKPVRVQWTLPEDLAWLSVSPAWVSDMTAAVDTKGQVVALHSQLDRCMKSGVVMGLSEALKEEVTFGKSKVTSTNWNSYKILTMGEIPEIKVVQLSRDDKGFGGGSEAANALVPPALAAALFDATARSKNSAYGFLREHSA